MTTLNEYINHRVPVGFRSATWLDRLVEKGKWIRQNHFGDYLVKDEDDYKLWVLHQENRESIGTEIVLYSFAEIKMFTPNGDMYWIQLDFDENGNFIWRT